MRYIEMEDRLFAELSKRFWARVSDEPDEADEPPSTWLTCVMVVCSTPKDFSMLIIAET
jgi:hypothetical protein